MSDTSLTLSFTREFAASPAAVWRCLTEPDLIKRWFAPAPVKTTEVEIDPVTGGIFRTVMVVPDHGEVRGAAGCVLLAESGKRLVWTNCLGPNFIVNEIGTSDMDFGFTADIWLHETGVGCGYKVHVHHATPAAAKAHEKMGFYDGWGAAADQLGAVAAGL